MASYLPFCIHCPISHRSPRLPVMRQTPRKDLPIDSTPSLFRVTTKFHFAFNEWCLFIFPNSFFADESNPAVFPFDLLRICLHFSRCRLLFRQHLSIVALSFCSPIRFMGFGLSDKWLFATDRFWHVECRGSVFDGLERSKAIKKVWGNLCRGFAHSFFSSCHTFFIIHWRCFLGARAS